MKKPRIIFFVSSIIIMICIITLCIYLDGINAINSVKFVVSSNDLVEEVNLYDDGSVCYAFLPSYTNLSNTQIDCNDTYRVSINDNDDIKKCNELEFNKEYTISIKGVLGITLDTHKLIIMKSDNIAQMSIQLTKGTLADIHSSKNIEKSGAMQVVSSKSEVDYSGKIKGIYGRGNTTWGQAKKPYNIEFDKAVNILNMGKSKKWCLLANACDESNLRDKIVYDCAKEIGLKYSVNSEFVDLYVNNEYLGLYLLTQSVDVGIDNVNITDLSTETSNVNQYALKKYNPFELMSNGIYTKGFSIPNNPADITGGYLVEFEMPERLADDKSGLTTKSGQNFRVKSPSEASKEQMTYISTFLQNVEDNLESEPSKWIDMDSFIYYYLVQESFGNMDIGSFYFYKDSDTIDSHLYAGPIWDFDMSMLNIYGDTDVFTINKWGWFKKLYSNQDFKNGVIDKYKNNFRKYLYKTINNNIPLYEKEIQSSYYMNEKRWNGKAGNS